MIKTGTVFPPQSASWLTVYLDQLLGFPNRVHDDQVDSTSQALHFFQMRFSGRINPERFESGRNRSNGDHRASKPKTAVGEIACLGGARPPISGSGPALSS